MNHTNQMTILQLTKIQCLSRRPGLQTACNRGKKLINFSMRFRTVSATRLAALTFSKTAPNFNISLCMALISVAIICESKLRKGPIEKQGINNFQERAVTYVPYRGTRHRDSGGTCTLRATIDSRAR